MKEVKNLKGCTGSRWDMNGIELEEFSKRMENLSEEEQKIAVEYIPDEVMFDELKRRATKRQEIIDTVEKSLKVSKEAW